jgi:hypothetical protein
VRRLALFVLLVAFTLAVACGSNPPARLVHYLDAGAEAGEAAAGDAAPDGPVSDASPYLGGPCVDDAQCNDAIACTYDSCDTRVGRCLNVPDDTQCQDGIYCDGQEMCVPNHGCEPGAVVSCDNGNACQIARCDEPTQSCVYTARDVDQDGDPDARCPPGKDCNDLDPNVSSLHAEVCKNGIDDNCNGLIDEQPCVVPQGQSCMNAVAANGAGSYNLSTLGATLAFPTSCSVGTPTSAQNVVAAVTVPPGPNVDLELWAITTVPVALAVQRTCGDPTSEMACNSGDGAQTTRTRARNVAPGTYYAVVTTQNPAAVELQVFLLTPTPAPTDVDCASATPVMADTPVAVSLVDPPTDVASACMSPTGKLTYSLALAQTQDVRIFASVVRGTGSPVLGLRAPACTSATDEIECGTLSGNSLYARALSAGTYVITVGASSPVDLTFVVEVSPPTATPPDQTCASPPAITPNGSMVFDLASHEHAIQDGCGTGPDAAYDLSLAVASDVLLVERVPQTESGAVSLDTPTCDTASQLACTSYGGGVARAGKRNVPAGDYRVVVSDDLGQQGSVDALVRPTVAPTIVPSGSAATCAQAIDASNGGFFTGDTSTVTNVYSSGCDAPGQSGAPDQVLALNLAQPQRVVLDMEGSAYTTLLDVRQGPGCPGLPVTGGCYVGFSAQRSFLDIQLAAGSYWLLVGGYSGAKGAWDLDVRVLPP